MNYVRIMTYALGLFLLGFMLGFETGYASGQNVAPRLEDRYPRKVWNIPQTICLDFTGAMCDLTYNSGVNACATITQIMQENDGGRILIPPKTYYCNGPVKTYPWFEILEGSK